MLVGDSPFLVELASLPGCQLHFEHVLLLVSCLLPSLEASSSHWWHKAKQKQAVRRKLPRIQMRIPLSGAAEGGHTGCLWPW